MRKSLFRRRDAASWKSVQSPVKNAAEMGSGRDRPKSALARLEATMGLIDDVDAALAAHDAIVAMPAAQRFQRIADFHRAIP
jgi:hypothetical protein